MTIEIAEFRKKVTRRIALGGFGAMAAIPALAEECRIGPPEHEKGPLVWMDMDQVELDAAYDQSFYAPLLRQDNVGGHSSGGHYAVSPLSPIGARTSGFPLMLSKAGSA